nr:putative d-xylulose kinase a [Quercus suber]
MNHPTTPGLYMFMLCYKNGGLAREQIRDQLNNDDSGSWDKFNSTALSTSELSQSSSSAPMRLGLYFPRPEIVPNLPSGQWRYQYDSTSNELSSMSADFVPDDARNIVESQFLSLRLRSHNLVHTPDTGSVEKLPPQPRRVYLVGGGSANPAIAKICGEVLGSVEGVFKLDIGGNACALGSAYKAVWGCERKDEKETFEDLIGERWDEAGFVNKVADGYKKGVFEKYGDAIEGFGKMEKLVLEEEGELLEQRGGGTFMAPHDQEAEKGAKAPEHNAERETLA